MAEIDADPAIPLPQIAELVKFNAIREEMVRELTAMTRADMDARMSKVLRLMLEIRK